MGIWFSDMTINIPSPVLAVLEFSEGNTASQKSTRELAMWNIGIDHNSTNSIINLSTF
jgi:hypothetical protein